MAKMIVKCNYCGNAFERKRSEIQPSGLTFCTHHCAASYTNTHRINPMSIRRNHRLEKQPKCNNPLCKNKLQLERFQFCSMKCRVECAKEKDRIDVRTIIQDFVRKNGRIPIKYELAAIYSRARVGYGTWNKAIESAGYESNPAMFAKHYIANDGHKCDSMAEKIVDDWLSANRIDHRVHVPYPWNNGMKCDFFIGELWIEIFGLEGSLDRYDQLKKAKLRLIKLNKLQLLKLNLKDVYDKNLLNEKLKSLLS